MAEDAPRGPIITPNGLPENQVPPGGPGFGKQPTISWEPPAIPNRPATDPVGGVTTGNEMPQPKQ